MAFPNKRAGQCIVCEISVAAEAGLVFKKDGGWRVVCNSSQCQVRALGAAAPASGPVVRELRADGVIVMPYDAAATPIIKGMPGARPLKNDDARRTRDAFWIVSTAAADRMRVLEAATRLGLAVAPELLVVQHAPSTDEAVARAVNGGAYKYQLEGVEWLASHPRALLGDDMGLGKTAQTLWAHDGQGLLVICPSTLKLTWKAEASRWRPDLTPVVCEGRGSFVIPAPGQIVMINYDIMPLVLTADGYVAWVEKIRTSDKIAKTAATMIGKDRSLDHATAIEKATAAEVAKTQHVVLTETQFAQLAKCTIVVDEAHRVKNYKAKRSIAVKAMREASARCWSLTGTPLPNRPFDLYGVLETCGMDREVFGGFGGFLKAFGGHKSKWGGYEFDGPDASVPEKLRRVMIRRLKTEVLKDLPSKIRSTMVVNDLPAALRRQMDRAWDEWTGEDAERSELPDFSEFSEIRAALASSRIDAMHEWCEDREEEGAPVLVFSAHRAPVEAAGAREGWGAILGDTPIAERQRLVEAFQAGKLKGLALTIVAGGVGITLTRASCALFVDLDWTPANNLQAEDRMVRIGQLATCVQIVRMVSNHVLDAHVHALLDQKMALVEAAVERTVAYEIPKAAANTAVTTVEETAEAFEARMAARVAVRLQAVADLEREEAHRKIKSALGRMGSTPDFQVPDSFSDEVAEALRGAVTFLAEQCDGAVDKDGVGFNKPDAAMGRWLACTGMADLASLQLAWAISRKYVRQAGKMFPAAYKVRIKTEVA